MKKTFALFGFLMIVFNGFCATDGEQEITNAIRSGNWKKIASYFDNSIELNLPDNEGLYSKAQAELILKDFFTKNTAKNYTAKHGGDSKDGAHFTIGTLNTSNGNFRTYFFLKKEGDKKLIKEFRIEKE
jgi:hypothetical protein